MATSDTAGDVVVDTALVAEEVLIDGESAFHGTVVVELILDGVNGGGVDDGVGLALVLFPSGTVGALLVSGAVWGDTGLGGVRKATLGHNTGVGKILPGKVEVATIATVVVVVA